MSERETTTLGGKQRMVPIVVVVTEDRAADLARVASNANLDEWEPFMERNGWTAEMLVGGALIDGALADAEGPACEFCGQPAPEDQYHPYWHDDGAPMASCDACLDDPEPQPTEGPDYHADHAAWLSRQDSTDHA